MSTERELSTLGSEKMQEDEDAKDDVRPLFDLLIASQLDLSPIVVDEQHRKLEVTDHRFHLVEDSSVHK